MKNQALRVLYLYNGLFTLAGNLLGPLYAVFAAKFTTGVFGISLSWAVFMLSSTVCEFLLGRFGDRVQQKRTFLLLGMLIRAVAWMGLLFVDNLPMLLIVQIMIGIGEGLGSPSFDAIFAEHLDSGRHIRDYANWKVIASGVTVIGVLVGGWVVASFGFGPLFVMMSSLAVISFMGILLQPVGEL